jgi:hypothetical protein
VVKAAMASPAHSHAAQDEQHRDGRLGAEGDDEPPQQTIMPR